VKLSAVGALVCSIALSACAQQKTWLKPGAGPDDFNQDKYACMQQSQQPNSAAYVNSYGGFSNSGIITNNNLFGACMNARGWALTAVTDPKESTTEFNALNGERRQACLSAEFQALFAKKMPCNALETTPEQLSDRSKISPNEKVALSKWQTVNEGYSERAATIYRQYFSRNGDALASILQRAGDESRNAALDLSNGRISWGDYNKRRLDINKRVEQDTKFALAT
jgi:hypothetical protein